MTSIRRHLRLASLALAAAAGTQAGAGDEGEWEHPFAGVLPEPDGFASVNPPDEGVELTRHVAGSRIIDFETGKPLPGATLSFFPEDASAAATSYVKSAAAGTADVTGLAAFEFPDRRQRAHWVADAPGKAPSFQFGPRPASIVALHNGAPVKGRLVDPLGRAVEGVPIDAYGGTSHAPTVRTTRTMKDGTFALPSLAPAAFAWCATAPAGTCRVPAGEKTLGRRAPDFVLGGQGHPLQLRHALRDCTRDFVQH